MIIHSLFPTPVSFVEEKFFLTDSEMEFIQRIETQSNEGNRISVNKYLFQYKELSRLKTFCEEQMIIYFNEIYQTKHHVVPYVTQSWANYANKGEWHHKHCHNNSMISGVYYVNASAESDKIHFYRDIHQRLKVLPKEYNRYNSDSWWLGVETGQLILFPSELIHSVNPVQTDTTRISIAFNTFFSGYLGDEDDLTALKF